MAVVSRTESAGPAADPTGRRRRRRRVWVGVIVGLLAVLGVVAVSVVLVGMDALRAQASLQSASSIVGPLRAAVLAGDDDVVEPALAQLQQHTADAVEDTDGPHWWIAARLPRIGASVAAVQTVSTVIDDLATDALPNLAEATELLDPAVLAPQGGRIELGPFIDTAPQIVRADDSVRAAKDRLEAVDPSRVMWPVNDSVIELQDMVNDVAMTTATASRAAQLLPTMLGGYGQRQYVLLTQSPAELRSTGGIPGAWILLTVNDGSIEFAEQYGAGPFNSETPVLPVTEEEDILFTDRLVRNGANPTLTPDFPRAAEIALAMWAKSMGTPVDGVLSVDPVALQYVLGAIGPVTMPSGQVLDGQNAAQVLLNQIYIDFPDTDDQDEFFGDAAVAVFEALMGGSPDVSATIDALARAADEGRLLINSTDPREQALLDGTVLSGELRGEVGGAPVVGVYLNDGSATKMSYYLDYDVSVERISCLGDGARRLRVSFDITSSAGPEAADFPSYLSGGGWLPAGYVQTNVLLYSPYGGTAQDAWVDGEPSELTGYYTHEGMDVAATTLTFAPGESRSIVLEVDTAPWQDEPATVRVTPGSHATEVVVNDSTC